ncbi:winged helix DNA-binding protein [Nocardia shimofusensis]|uniref:winged helix DNA-binding protein n=1 Tax=Nocardia shimofusensis TaxID=228596 RepID=UPI000AED1776|nr:winged helix DNA-binding protein [Nocardia shimofusensis]
MKPRVVLLLVVAAALLPLAACGGSADEPDRQASTPTGEHRMIGYQVKRLDQLIESTFDRLLGDAGITRRQWQTLNTLSAGPADEAQLTDALRPFWEVNDESLEELIRDLTGRGWVVEYTGRYSLTDAGRAAHAAAEESVGRIRELSAAGVGEEEFGQMMDVLGRIIDNLEQAGA